MRVLTTHLVAATIAIGVAVPAAAQIKGPVAPALTPEQTALSKHAGGHAAVIGTR